MQQRQFLSALASLLAFSSAALPFASADVGGNAYVGSMLGYSIANDDISGLPFFYADGGAYVGSGTPAGAQVVSQITLSQNTTTGTVSIAAVNASSSVAAEIDGQVLYINLSGSGSGSYPAGFVPNTTVSSTDITTTDFIYYGTVLYWLEPSRELIANWSAVSVEAEGDEPVWAVYWNLDYDDGSAEDMESIELKGA